MANLPLSGIDYTTPEGKLIRAYGSRDKWLAARKARDDAKKKYTATNKALEKANKDLDIYLTAPGYGLYSRLNVAKEIGRAHV